MKTIDVIIPHMGSNSEEATVQHWLKKVGDQVKEGESLAELETDKVNFELEAPASGLLAEILMEENQVVPFGEVAARIESRD